MDSAVRTNSRSQSIDRTALVLGVGDVGLLAALVLVGQRSHGLNPMEQPIAALEATAPFVVGWLVAAALAGIYTRGVATSVTRAVRLTAVAWIAAANVGLILRQGVFDATATWPFPLVITGFGLLLLVGWRVGYAAVASRTA